MVSIYGSGQPYYLLSQGKVLESPCLLNPCSGATWSLVRIDCVPNAYAYASTCVPSIFSIISRVGHNRKSAPYMTVCMVISLLKIPYVHRIYL